MRGLGAFERAKAPGRCNAGAIRYSQCPLRELFASRVTAESSLGLYIIVQYRPSEGAFAVWVTSIYPKEPLYTICQIWPLESAKTLAW